MAVGRAGWPLRFIFPSPCSCLPSISDQRVASVAINSSGDWIAFGCSGWFPVAKGLVKPDWTLWGPRVPRCAFCSRGLLLWGEELPGPF